MERKRFFHENGLSAMELLPSCGEFQALRHFTTLAQISGPGPG